MSDVRYKAACPILQEFTLRPLAGWASSNPRKCSKTTSGRRKQQQWPCRGFLEQPMPHKASDKKSLEPSLHGELWPDWPVVGAILHETTAFSSRATLKDFRKEIKRLRAWYRRRKRKTRPARGIKRSHAAAEFGPLLLLDSSSF